MNFIPDDLMTEIIAFLTEVSKWIYIILFLIVFIVVFGLIIAVIVNVRRYQKYKKNESAK